MATEYHVVTLPNKGKVPVRDHYLRDGRTFSATGDVLASEVRFDGTGNVQLNTKLADGVIQVNNISNTSIANNISQSSTTDNRLVSTGQTYTLSSGNAKAFICISSTSTPPRYAGF